MIEEVALPGAWSDFYSRPRAVVLGERRWLVTDTPASVLWLVELGKVRRVDLSTAGIVPTGLALSGGKLYLADAGARVWVFDLPGEI